MHRQKIFALISIPFLMYASGNSPVRSAEKTITRTNDYIVVQGRELKNSLGKKISDLSLFSSTGGVIKPIPFQVDEVDPRGEWVLTEIPPEIKKGSIKPDSDSDNGLIDENDELVFMINDSGGRIPAGRHSFGALSTDEIKLIDPQNDGKSWVYLCSVKKNPPQSSKDYMKYAHYQNQIISKNYILGFPPDLAIFPEFLSIQGYRDILDCVKVRARLKIFWIPYSIDEQNLVSRLSLYKDGPVRVIRRTRTSLMVAKIFETPSLGLAMVSYNNISIIPFKLEVPLSVKKYKSVFSVSARGGVDMHDINGWRVKTNGCKNMVLINGKMDQSENRINGNKTDWFLLAGEGRAFLVRVILDRKPDGSVQKIPIKTRLYYNDNAALADPPEDNPGQTPFIGFWFDGFEDLDKGTLYFYMIFYLMENYQDGMEKKYLDIIDNPIKIIVNGR